VQQGYYADVVVFDPETVSDRSTFAELQQAPVGINAVLVNGVIALQDGKVLCKTAGRLLAKTDQ